jgi:protein-tyrosine-phosphatase
VSATDIVVLALYRDDYMAAVPVPYYSDSTNAEALRGDLLRSPRALLAQAIDALPAKLELVYVDYRDELNDEQVRALISGDNEALWTSLDNFESEARWSGVRYALEEALPDPEDRDALTNDEDAYQRFREECDERDESDFLADLLRNTPRKMVKYGLNYEVASGSWAMDDDEIAEEVRGIAEAAGIDLESNHATLLSLVREATYGGTLHVLHHTDLSDLYPRPTQAVFTDPYLLVHDKLNGSGYMEQIKGEVTVAIGDESLRLDAGPYSWSDDIAGIVHSACDTPVKFIKKENEHEDHG